MRYVAIQLAPYSMPPRMRRIAEFASFNEARDYILELIQTVMDATDKAHERYECIRAYADVMEATDVFEAYCAGHLYVVYLVQP